MENKGNSKGNGFAIGELREMAQIVKDNNLSKLAITQGEFMILLESKQEVVVAPTAMPAPISYAGNIPASGVQAPPPPAAIAASPAPAAGYSGNVVKAPIVGTFYASSAPDKPAFVTVGSSVKKGDVIMIIESMKLMNEVNSEFDGTVAEILVKDGDPVEYDQPIMIIK